MSTATRQPGMKRRTVRVASIPSSTGMSRSIRITSGRSEPACSTALLPLGAWPTTSTRLSAARASWSAWANRR